MRRLRDNGLSLTLLLLFLLTFCLGHVQSSHLKYNEEREEQGEPPLSLGQYLKSADFLEITAENWESEFLEMFLYVLLTSFLFQRGSSESKDPDQPEEAVDRDPRDRKNRKDAPWPVRRGGFVLRLYEHSLSITFLVLFLLAAGLHAVAGAKDYNEERAEYGKPPVTSVQYLGTSQFWSQSFQNWQSEFLAIFLMVVLSIWLRERGSPESKPVDAPHSQTGED